MTEARSSFARVIATRREVIRGFGRAGAAGATALAAACGGAPPDARTPASAGDAAPAGTARPNVVATDLSVLAYGDTSVQERYDTVAAAFNARFAPRLKYTPVIVPFGQYIDKVVTSIAADTAPDVFNMWAQYKVEWTGKGLVLDLTSRVKASSTASTALFLQPMVDAMTHQGKIWGTAQDFNGQAIFVNLDLLEQRGVPAPADSWTMDQYRDLAKRLTDPGKGIFGSTNFINQAGSANFAFQWNYGQHYWIDRDGKKALVGSNTSVAAHEVFADMQFKDRSIPWRDNPLPPGTSQATGNLAFSLVWGNYPSALYETWDKTNQPPFNWKLLPFPKGPKDQKDFSHGHLWSIANSNRRPDAAWALAEWIGGLDGWREWAKTHRQPLPVKDAALWKTYTELLPADRAKDLTSFLVDRLYSGLAFNFQYWPTFGDCSQVMGEALKQIFVENANAKASLEEAQRQMDAILTRG